MLTDLINHNIKLNRFLNSTERKSFKNCLYFSRFQHQLNFNCKECLIFEILIIVREHQKYFGKGTYFIYVNSGEFRTLRF